MNALQVAIGEYNETIVQLQARLGNLAIEFAKVAAERDALKARVAELEKPSTAA